MLVSPSFIAICLCLLLVNLAIIVDKKSRTSNPLDVDDDIQTINPLKVDDETQTTLDADIEDEDESIKGIHLQPIKK